MGAINARRWQKSTLSKVSVPLLGAWFSCKPALMGAKGSAKILNNRGRRSFWRQCSTRAPHRASLSGLHCTSTRKEPSCKMSVIVNAKGDGELRQMRGPTGSVYSTVTWKREGNESAPIGSARCNTDELTDLAKLRGKSTSNPFSTAMW